MSIYDMSMRRKASAGAAAWAALSLSIGMVLSAAADGDGAYWATTPMECHWIGAVKHGDTDQDGYDTGVYPIPSEAYADWTNQNNWAEGVVPGLIQVPQADGSVATNGCRGCTAVFDGNSRIRVVQLFGHVSVGAIRVTGATAPRFIFGHFKWTTPSLNVESGGSIRVGTEVPEAPYFACQITPFEVQPVADQTMLTVENNSAGVLDVGYVGNVSPAFSDSVGFEIVRYEGTGAVRKRNKTSCSNWSMKVHLAQDGGRYVANTTTNSSFAGSDNIGAIAVDASSPRQHVEIPEGKAVLLERNAAFDTVMGDLLVDGGGILRFSQSADGSLSAGAGRTLEVACGVATVGGKGLAVGKSGRAGLVRLSGRSTFSNLSVMGGATCEVPWLGMDGESSPVGVGAVSLGGRSILRYVGPGETTDRALVGDGFGTVEVAGGGDLVWRGGIAPSTAGSLSYAYTIATPGEGRFVVATASVTKYLDLADGARVAFAAPDGADTVAVSKLRVSGAASVEVPAGVKVEIAALSRSSGGTLDIAVERGGGISIAGFDGSELPDWITVGGRRAYRAADGSVYSASGAANSAEISAHGDAVPDSPFAAVGITRAGDPAAGNDSLAAASVSVLALNHEVAEDATVAIAEGETLDARLLRIRPGAGDLAIGHEAGVGEVKSSAGALMLETADASQTLTLNARLANPPSSPLAVSGPGTVRLAAIGGVAGVDSADLVGDGEFDLSGGSLRLVESGADGVGARLASSSPARIDVFGGVLRLEGDADLPLDKAIVGPGELVLAGARLSSDVELDGSSSKPAVSLEVGTTNQVGVLRVQGGSFTGRLEMASWGSDNARGAVYQSGGEVVTVTPCTTTDVVGRNGYAYYELSGGSFVAAGDWCVGRNGEGLLAVAGGEVRCEPTPACDSGFRLGRDGGRTQLLVGGGGTFNATNLAGAILFPDYNAVDSGGQITVENGGRLLGPSRGISLGFGCGTEEVSSVVNLNGGGEIATGYIVRNSAYVRASEEWPEGTASDERYANASAHVNCDGGTFRCMAWGVIFGNRGTYYAYPPSRVTLYEGGLTVDTAGLGVAIGQGGGLRAPSGLGVAGVDWTAEDEAWLSEQGLVGPPIVRIAGDGAGATAVADFDSASGRVRAIRVTGRGNDYTRASAELIWNKKVRRTLPCSLAACASGGLTKAGRGYLELCETNTYAGATVVREGTLRLKCDDAISASSALRLEGGELDMDGHSQTFSDIFCDGGTVVGGRPSVTGLAVDFDDVRRGAVRELDASLFEYAPGAKLRIDSLADSDFADAGRRYRVARFRNGSPAGALDLSEVQAALPDRWVVRSFGSYISLARMSGAVVTVR